MKSKGSGRDELIETIVAQVGDSTRYGAISQDLIRRIATREVENRDNFREALKGTKNKLHQIGGAYFDRPINYVKCLDELKKASLVDREIFFHACKRVMCYHSSTRERLPEIDRYYHDLLADLPPARRILDIACGLNPVAIPWMGLPADIEYIAVDIYTDMIEFINQFFPLVGINGSAMVCDVIGNPPTIPVDIAYAFKVIPCLEQVDKNAGVQLLKSIRAKYIIVSFPSHSLGGRRDKGMQKNYTNRLHEIVADESWDVRRIEYPTELVFIVRKA